MSEWNVIKFEEKFKRSEGARSQVNVDEVKLTGDPVIDQPTIIACLFSQIREEFSGFSKSADQWTRSLFRKSVQWNLTTSKLAYEIIMKAWEAWRIEKEKAPTLAEFYQYVQRTQEKRKRWDASRKEHLERKNRKLSFVKAPRGIGWRPSPEELAQSEELQKEYFHLDQHNTPHYRAGEVVYWAELVNETYGTQAFRQLMEGKYNNPERQGEVFELAKLRYYDRQFFNGWTDTEEDKRNFRDLRYSFAGTVPVPADQEPLYASEFDF